GQPFRQRHAAPPAAGTAWHVAHDQAGGPHLAGLVVLRGAAGAADVGIGQGDDLARVRGVGEDFLVAGHGRVEHDLADGKAGRADGYAFEDGAVLEREDCRWGHWRAPTWGCRTPPARRLAGPEAGVGRAGIVPGRAVGRPAGA